jgi:hypothetical protein
VAQVSRGIVESRRRDDAADQWGLVLNNRVCSTNAEWTRRQQGSGAGPHVSTQRGLDQASGERPDWLVAESSLARIWEPGSQEPGSAYAITV